MTSTKKAKDDGSGWFFVELMKSFDTNGTVQRLRAEVDKLTKQRDALKGKTPSHDSVIKVTQLTVEIENLKRELDRHKSNEAELRLRVDDLDEKVRTMSAEQTRNLDEIHTQKAKVDSLEKQLDAAKTKGRDGQGKTKELQDSINVAKQRISELESDIGSRSGAEARIAGELSTLRVQAGQTKVTLEKMFRTTVTLALMWLDRGENMQKFLAYASGNNFFSYTTRNRDNKTGTATTVHIPGYVDNGRISLAWYSDTGIPSPDKIMAIAQHESGPRDEGYDPAKADTWSYYRAAIDAGEVFCSGHTADWFYKKLWGPNTNAFVRIISMDLAFILLFHPSDPSHSLDIMKRDLANINATARDGTRATIEDFDWSNFETIPDGVAPLARWFAGQNKTPYAFRKLGMVVIPPDSKVWSGHPGSQAAQSPPPGVWAPDALNMLAALHTERGGGHRYDPAAHIDMDMWWRGGIQTFAARESITSITKFAHVEFDTVAADGLDPEEVQANLGTAYPAVTSTEGGFRQISSSPELIAQIQALVSLYRGSGYLNGVPQTHVDTLAQKAIATIGRIPRNSHEHTWHIGLVALQFLTELCGVAHTRWEDDRLRTLTPGERNMWCGLQVTEQGVFFYDPSSSHDWEPYKAQFDVHGFAERYKKKHTATKRSKSHKKCVIKKRKSSRKRKEIEVKRDLIVSPHVMLQIMHATHKKYGKGPLLATYRVGDAGYVPHRRSGRQCIISGGWSARKLKGASLRKKYVGGL